MEPTIPSEVTFEPPASTVEMAKESQKLSAWERSTIKLKEQLSHIKLVHKIDPSTFKYNDLPYEPMKYNAFEQDQIDFEPNYDYE